MRAQLSAKLGFFLGQRGKKLSRQLRQCLVRRQPRHPFQLILINSASAPRC